MGTAGRDFTEVKKNIGISGKWETDYIRGGADQDEGIIKYKLDCYIKYKNKLE